jgi:hypothetical protein
MTACPTCEKPLKKVMSRHKCPHGVWCGVVGQPQLTYRSRTCEACNEDIRKAEEILRPQRALALIECWAKHGLRPCCAGLERDLRAGRETAEGVAEHMNDYVTKMAREALSGKR